jgi:hypothetical protein
MKRIFLGGRTDSTTITRPIGSIYKRGNKRDNSIFYESDDSEEDDYDNNNNNNNSNYRSFGDDEMRFIEVWDYVGGTSFRGFIADKEAPCGRVEKTLFLFFEHVADTQLKHGYVVSCIVVYVNGILIRLAGSWLLSNWRPNALRAIA